MEEQAATKSHGRSQAQSKLQQQVLQKKALAQQLEQDKAKQPKLQQLTSLPRIVKTGVQQIRSVAMALKYSWKKNKLLE